MHARQGYDVLKPVDLPWPVADLIETMARIARRAGMLYNPDIGHAAGQPFRKKGGLLPTHDEYRPAVPEDRPSRMGLS